ncbi:MAG: prepilin peptidase [Candidatus Hydrogenedens sp.]|nr:prepilin peptidase [Candidatus Hydrogenedens sp.]
MLYLIRAADALQPLFMTTAFALGAVLGSFANVCVARWPVGQSIVKPGSRCPKCMHPLAWYDNIPIVGWVFLRGKCRYCSTSIHWQYPLVELLTALLFLLVYWKFGFTIASPVYMMLAFALVVCTFQDFADWTIPDEITYPGIPAGLAVAVAGMFLGEASGLRVLNPIDAGAGILLGGAIPFVIDRVTVVLLKKPGMGFGDVKLLAMIGGFVGWQGVLGTFFLACLLGSFIGVGVIAYFRFKGPSEKPEAAAGEKKEAASDDEIELEGHYLPFGPYLALAGFLFVLYGPELVQLYVDFVTLDSGSGTLYSI